MSHLFIYKITYQIAKHFYDEFTTIHHGFINKSRAVNK